jgi:hypothetical protein
MSTTDLYADWKAPAADGDLLIWPEPRELLDRTRENHARLSSADDVRIQNTPLSQLRRELRQFIGHDDAQPLLATGHQSELYHPGVWVKDVLIDHAASLLNGQAYHFAVDTDSPKHLQVRWPGASMPVTDDAAIATAPWSALLAPPTPAQIQEIENEALRDWPRFGFEPMLFDFLQSLRRLAIEPSNLSATITNAQHALDWELGLRHHAMLVSPLLMSQAFLALAHHVMSRPDAFAASYNRALAEYRRETNTTSPMRPMPDLFVSDESIEVPFWLDNVTDATRSRPSVFRTGDVWSLELLNGEAFAFRPDIGAEDAAEALRKFLDRSGHRLAPRALTLTIFLRLLVVDQFVHGIGGGRYDQVADKLIADHLGLVPPAFSVTTATLYFPTAVGRQRACLPCLRQEGHRLKHAVLGTRKRELVAQIAELPRRSSQREEIFITMQRERRAAAAVSDELRRWEQRLRESEAREQEEDVLFDRELFYAVQSRERLAMMIDKYKQPFT